eukprot:scaffold63010_cov81-Cyclotella_meneghiniana.AAC.1
MSVKRAIKVILDALLLRADEPHTMIFFTSGTLDDRRTRPQALSFNNDPGDLVRTQIANMPDQC